jgi:lipoprotein-releasing system permease protein
MYQLLLTRRYLVSKIMPMLAAVAVLLCTAMVLIVWSVMGGFLNMLINSGRTVVGDVIIAWPNAGFAHYDDLIKRLESDPEIKAATPVIETYGILSLPDGRKETIILRGVDGESYARVTAFADTIYWKPLSAPLEKDTARLDPRLDIMSHESLVRMQAQGLALTKPDPKTGQESAALVMGIEVSGFNRRRPEGYYIPIQRERTAPDGTIEWVDSFLPRDGRLLISVAPLNTEGAGADVVSLASRYFPVANEFQSGLFELDQRMVLLRLDACQEMLKLGAARRIVRGDQGPAVLPVPSDPDEETFDEPGLRTVEDPARVTHVFVRGMGDMSQGQAAVALADRCRDIYRQFAADHAGEVPRAGDIIIHTWEDRNRTMISAVRQETALLLFLFMIISLVAVFLILAIFWSMVAEKTKDIGVLRAVGASAPGIAGLWIGYGLAIGLVGGVLGVGLAYLVVYNINPIHDWLGRALNIVIWDPAVYYFPRIPSEVDPGKATIVFIGAVISSVLGAFVPAFRAALMSPVRALRFE